MDIYSTADAPRNTRAAYWNSVYTTRFAHVTFNPADQEAFEAELRVGAIGPLGIARVQCMSAEIERTRAHVTRQNHRLFSFLMVQRGRGTFSHYGHHTELEAGDITLCDSAAPHVYRVEDAAEIVMLRIPAHVLKEHLPSPEFFCGRHLAAAQGLTSTVTTPSIYALGTVTTVVSLLVMALALGAGALLGRRSTRRKK